MFQIVANNALYNLPVDFNGIQLHKAIKQIVDVSSKSGVWPMWILGNEETSRVKNKFGRSSMGLQIVQLLLPGIKCIYYGEEIQMTNHPFLSYNDTKDDVAREAGPKNFTWVSRDPYRTPMAWNMSKNAGQLMRGSNKKYC